MLVVDLVRHGVTEWNRERRIQGHLDVPLSELGRDQARALAERLCGEADAVDLIVSSDLVRARQTADIVAAALSRPVTVDARWRERDLGDLQGRLWAEVEAGGLGILDAPPNGETRRAQHARVFANLEALRADRAAGRVLVFTHGGCVRSALAMCVDHEISPWLPNTSLTRLSHDGARWSLDMVGDAAHLELH